ncbi:MAG: hypothetical protein ACRERX_09355 [Pseudomonas sp.]
MKTFLLLLLLVVTAWFAFVVGREVGREEATSALQQPGIPETAVADTTVQTRWKASPARDSLVRPSLSSDGISADSLILASEAVVPERCGTRCGVQRWAVKTLSDVDRAAVQPRPVDTTIEALAAIPRPAGLPAHRRVAPHEITIYRVRGYLAAWDEQSDGDYHVVLFGLEDQRVSLIAEIPNPGCQSACKSGFAGRYAAARQSLLTGLQELARRGEETVVLEVTGVGFFDHNHGQSGAAPNFFELHPVLTLRVVR